MGLFEPHHLIIILIIALVIFGPGKIGDLGGSLGRAVRDFKKSMNEDPAPQPSATTATAERRPEPIARSQEPEATMASAGTAAKETA
jgi:sec-independent protein translocase protein TatA